MDVNCYLPDELGERAKAAELNFSALLRSAIFEELEHREALAEASKGAEEHLLDVETDERGYTARLVGKSVAYDERGDVEIFVTEDERVFAYDRNRLRLAQLGVEPSTTLKQELEGWLTDMDALIDAGNALGVKITVDV
jgi:hypothetical protein